ncbi:MAG: hypothetical protein Q8K81_04035 [Sulfuricurvum sp.]|nr:hypothetical protein [Sulfuricurvum sp.]
MRISLSFIIFSLLLAGCATNAAISPSQNPSLQAVSPNTSSASAGGAMQHSLDNWLKDEWTPLTTSQTAEKNGGDKNVVKGSAAPSSAVVPKEETPFTLQSYADKWKVYHENQAKIKEGKPKEASHIDTVNALPVIGK